MKLSAHTNKGLEAYFVKNCAQSKPEVAKLSSRTVSSLSVFKPPRYRQHFIGVAAGSGSPDFWYSSMRGYPIRLLRSAQSSCVHTHLFAIKPSSYQASK